MTILHEKTFSLNGVTSNFCMKVTGKRTDAVLALIRTRDTTDRAPPPKCGNGFRTDKLPFAKGHVIALELGGSDHEHNVVPQFACWQGQGNGPWRIMETSLTAFDGDLMLVEIGYGRTGGTQDYATMKATYENDPLGDWTDERIPDQFTVTVWPAGGVDPSTITSDSAFAAAVAKLKGQAATHVVPAFVLGDGVPEPDRGTSIARAACFVAADLQEKYEETYPDPPLTPISYLMADGTLDDIRTELASVDGVTATEAANFQLGAMMNVMYSTTPAQLNKKRKRRKSEGHPMVSGITLMAGYPQSKKPKKFK